MNNKKQIENEIEYLNTLIEYYKTAEKIAFRNEISLIILLFILTVVITHLSLLNKKI